MGGRRGRRNPVGRLDRWLYARAELPEGSLPDGAVTLLSAAADHSLLWVGIAGLLAVAGGRFGRRAALRGLLSVAITSSIANLPAKRLTHRPRPSGRVLRLRRHPRSSSFPSGHSASAVAFATGAALELPAVGPVLGPLAAGVALSRVSTGAHYPSDVVAGAVLGGTVALGTRRFWPVASREPATIRRSAARVDTTALPQGKGMAIVVNPSAGPALSGNPAGELQTGLPEAEILELSDDLPLDRALKRAASAQVIGIAGGDGSVNAAAEVAIEHGVPLAVIPAGTLNHLARDLGLDSVGEAIDAVRNGHAAAVDVGTIDGRPFLNTASFGGYVELVDAREKLESRIGKWPAVVVALFRVLRRSDPVDVEIDGEPRRIWMIFIGNCRYRPSGFAPSWREHLDDGLLDVRTVDADEPWSRTRLILALLSGRLGRCRVYRQRLTKRIEFRSPDASPIRLARDGETFDGSPYFVVTKSPTPLPIYVPRPNDS